MRGQLLIKSGLLWDGLSTAPHAHMGVLIEDGKVVAVDAIHTFREVTGARIVDWSGFTVIPGLIDSHTHLSMDGTLDNYLDHMTDPVPILMHRAEEMMRRDLAAGITTCRCCGDREFLDIACRHAVGEGRASGPYPLVATRGIRAPEGHGFVGYAFKGREEIRRAIRENAAAGADFIKTYISGTLKGNGGLTAYLKRDEITTAAEESHTAGLPITAHCVGGEGFDHALDAGFDALEHGYHITDAQIERLAKSRTWIVLTPGPMLSEERIRRLPAGLITGHLEEMEMIAQRMRAFIHAAIPFAVGTDGLHGGLADEIGYLVMLGATPLMAIQAATINAARVSRIDSEAGSIEAGKRADLVAIDGNPFQDVVALKDVAAVMQNGVMVRGG